MSMTKQDRKLPSYVYRHWNRYEVSQVVNGEKRLYGRYNTPEEAIHKRNQLVEDGTIRPRQGQHRIKNYDDRYIHKRGSVYRIGKKVDGRMEHFGVFKSLEDAREERDYLESIDWDYGNMD